MKKITYLLPILSVPVLPILAQTKETKPVKPNILLIYADDIGYGDLSCNGQKTIHTPNVDRLASEGVRFTNAHSAAATSTPSRYAMLTGEYAWRREDTGIARGDAGMIIRPEQYTLADMLKDAGYKTGVIGKWHLGLGDKTGTQDWNKQLIPGTKDIGFDYSFIMAATGDRTPCVYVNNDLVVNLDQNDPIYVSYEKNFEGEPTGKDNPELLTMHPSQGHDQSIINGISRIGFMKGGKKALWKDEEIAYTITDKAVQYIEDHKDEPFFLYFATQDAHVPRVPAPEFVGKSGMGPRGDVILQFDWSVGQVLDALDRLGLTENTIVILSSDNGPVVDDGYKDQAVELLGNHKPAGPFRGGKYSAFEGGTRVPCLLRWPNKVKPKVSDALVCHLDWYRSFAKLLNIELPEKVAKDSQNYLNTWLGKSDKSREYLVLQNLQNNLSITHNNWKYIKPGKGAAYNPFTDIELGNSMDVQLYNLKNDIEEQINVSDKYPKKVKELSKKLTQIINEKN